MWDAQAFAAGVLLLAVQALEAGVFKCVTCLLYTSDAADER